MTGVTLKLTGVDEVLNKLDTTKMEEEITDVLKGFGADVMRDAIQNVENNLTTDRGGLVNSINFKSERPLTVEIFAHKEYAAYIEFGTRKFAAAYVATLPPNWKAFALQFKGSGSGGTFEQLVKAITEWAERTGKIPVEMAYVKALKIVRDGIRAQPFLFPAVEKNLPILIRDLKDLLGAK